MKQKDKVLSVLEQHPEGVSTRDFRVIHWVMNPGEAVRLLRKEGHPVETFTIFTTENGRKVNGYRLPKGQPTLWK